MVTDGAAAARATRQVGRMCVALGASFVVGCLESWAQGLLPAAFAPVSNSASGWVLVTALLVFWARPRVTVAAIIGAASVVLLVVGYAIVSTGRGFPYSPVTWGAIGIVVGPFVGISASWLRHAGLRAALGGGVLAGIGFGDALYGLTTVSDTTGVTYWVGIGIVGVALFTYVLTRCVTGSSAATRAAIGTASTGSESTGTQSTRTASTRTVSVLVLIGTTAVCALVLAGALRLR
ncbi:DUF6518 family protein [Gryllotalpicola reticulitermitis]|uniref:DUF6518 family protein n=1 Tax=Gryllotalpicola reticulitermitis TaxID=1184153 RepID=A0ABV8Q2N4_9MICO